MIFQDIYEAFLYWWYSVLSEKLQKDVVASLQSDPWWSPYVWTPVWSPSVLNQFLPVWPIQSNRRAVVWFPRIGHKDIGVWNCLLSWKPAAILWDTQGTLWKGCIKNGSDLLISTFQPCEWTLWKWVLQSQ